MLARLAAIALGTTLGIGGLVAFGKVADAVAPPTPATTIGEAVSEGPNSHTSTACLYERYWTAEGCPGVSWIVSRAEEDAEAAAATPTATVTPTPKATSTSAPRPASTPSRPAPRPSKAAPTPSEPSRGC